MFSRRHPAKPFQPWNFASHAHQWPARSGQTMLELLFAACLLSLSLVPLQYLFNLTKPVVEGSQIEMMATLLAQHAMEKIVAFKKTHPDALPPITGEEPLVSSSDNPQAVSDYFRDILGKTEGLTDGEIPALYWVLKQFRCQVEIYYLDENLYKAIVYIHYDEDGQKRKVYLENLIVHSPSHSSAAQRDKPE